MESAKNVNEYANLADALEVLEMKASKGQGIEYIHWIVTDLRNGNIAAAKIDYANESDKYGSYPAIKQFLKEAGIAEEIDWSMED